MSNLFKRHTPLFENPSTFQDLVPGECCIDDVFVSDVSIALNTTTSVWELTVTLNDGTTYVAPFPSVFTDDIYVSGFARHPDALSNPAFVYTIRITLNNAAFFDLDLGFLAGSRGEVNDGTNLGGGEEVFSSKLGLNLQFKTLVAGTNVSLSSTATEITINSTSVGDITDGANFGTGTGIYRNKVGTILNFKTLLAGTNLSITDNGNELTINSLGLYGLFSQTAQGPTVTNTTTETDILGTGVGSLTVPANAFQVGDSFHAKVGGTISAQNGDDITIRVKNGATVLATTGAISLQAVTALAWEIEIDFTVRTIGATGQIFTNGNFAYNRNTGSLEGFVFSDVQTIDTTVASTLMITAEWGQAKTQDIIFTDMTTLYKTY